MNAGSEINATNPIEDIKYDKRIVGKYIYWVVYYARRNNDEKHEVS